jgi:hypothetical protein
MFGLVREPEAQVRDTSNDEARSANTCSAKTPGCDEQPATDNRSNYPSFSRAQPGNSIAHRHALRGDPDSWRFRAPSNTSRARSLRCALAGGLILSAGTYVFASGCATILLQVDANVSGTLPLPVAMCGNALSPLASAGANAARKTTRGFYEPPRLSNYVEKSP